MLLVMNSKKMVWQTRSGRLEATKIRVRKPSVEVRLLMRCLLKDELTVGFDILILTTAVGYSKSFVSQPGPQMGPQKIINIDGESLHSWHVLIL